MLPCVGLLRIVASAFAALDTLISFQALNYTYVYPQECSGAVLNPILSLVASAALLVANPVAALSRVEQ